MFLSPYHKLNQLRYRQQKVKNNSKFKTYTTGKQTNMVNIETHNQGAKSIKTDVQKLHQNMMTMDEKREILKNLDLFVLDNSLRETTVGQIFGHTLENKWEIYNEVKKVGFNETVVTAFSHMTRVGDTFIQELNQKGEDMTTKYGFVELSDSDVDGVPVDDVPIGLQKCRDLNLPNPIIEVDLAYFAFDYEKFTLEKICELLDKRIKWTRQNISQDSKIYINFRDFSDAMTKAPERVLGLARYISSYRPKLTGILYEEFGANFPEELGIYTKSVKQIMDSCGFDGHLLIHIHHQWGLSDAGILECLVNGANGIWAAVCEEGAAMGHASSCLTLMNLIRLGNTKVLKKYNCQELRNAAIAITKSVTGSPPPPKTVVVGERALDRVFGFPAFEPDNLKGFCLSRFFGDKLTIRITTLADNKMVRDALIENFGEDPQFTLEIATKMKNLMLEDLRANRKEEYQSCFGLAMLFDRAGGQLTGPMAETIEKVEIKNKHIKNLIAKIRTEWDEWDLRDNGIIDDVLDFNAFYNGFLAPYFGCYRCDETRKALKALDMDNDGMIDWNEFLFYLKWAGNAYPDTETARELLDIAVKEGLIPAMQDVLIDTFKRRIYKNFRGKLSDWAKQLNPFKN